MPTMERYLVYDAQCTTCNRLAETIQNSVGGKLEAIDIQGDRAKKLLDRAYPAGWERNPYLVTLDDGHVGAWTGTGAALRLAWLMGPRKALRLWSLAHRSGVPLPPGSKAATVYDVSRRRFLKASMAVASLGGVIGLTGLKSATAVLGQDCNPACTCYECGCCQDGCLPCCCNNYQYYCCSINLCNPPGAQCYNADCYDECCNFCTTIPFFVYCGCTG